MEVLCRYLLAVQLLSALIFINSTGLVHSDVKPENVLLIQGPSRRARNGTTWLSAKLADLGLAVKIGDPKGCTYGSEHFYAPEHLLVAHCWVPVPAAPNTDSFAFGLIAAEVLLGCSLSANFDNEYELANTHKRGTFSTVVMDQVKNVTGIQQKWVDLISSCLLSYTERPSPGELLRSLRSDPLFDIERQEIRADAGASALLVRARLRLGERLRLAFTLNGHHTQGVEHNALFCCPGSIRRGDFLPRLVCAG
jgi:serine/threonine protein kinase